MGPDGKPNPTYRCLFPEPPEPGTIPTCAEAGVLGALAGVLGSLMALEAIRVLVGGFGDGDEGLVGRLLMIDTRAMRFETLRYAWDPDNPLSGKGARSEALLAARELASRESSRPNAHLAGLTKSTQLMRPEIEAALKPAAVRQSVDHPVAEQDQRHRREKRDNIGKAAALKIVPRLDAVRRVEAVEFLRSILRHCLSPGSGLGDVSH